MSDGVLRLVVDRPEKRNSLTDDIVAAMTECVSTAGRDESVRAILLTGAGEHFCSGFDIVARNEDRAGRRPRVGSIQRLAPPWTRLVPLVASVQTPVVVVARGWVAGIGLHLLLAADFALVAEDAQLLEPFAERGFTPDSGATWLLPRRVGEVRPARSAAGRVLSGTEASEWGMVHAAVPGPELERAGEELLGTLASGPTVTLGFTKWLLHVSAVSPFDRQLEHEALALELSSRSEDFREGLAAFKEKRPPRFTGR